MDWQENQSAEINLKTAVAEHEKQQKCSIGAAFQQILVAAEQFQMGGRRLPKFC